MDIELKKEMVCVNEVVMRDNTQILVESDIIVPDIKSDMAKILQIDSQAMCEDVVSGDAFADITGKVGLNILYVPEGDTRPVCSISSILPFSARIENKNILPISKCVVSAEVYHIEFSMINSRKLSVKIVIELNTKCICENTEELVCDVLGEESIQKHISEFDIYNLICDTHSKINVRETLDFPSGKPSAVSVLKSDAKIRDKEVRAVTGKVIIKGSVYICTLYVSVDNTIEYMEHEVPFTEVIDADNVSEECIIDADANICSTEFSLRADNDGDMRLVDIDIIIDVEISASQTTNLSAVDDCFCAKNNLICESKPYMLDTLMGIGKSQEMIRTLVTFGENAPELINVYNLIAKPYITEVTANNGSALVKGSVDCYVLYLSASPSSPVSTQKVSADFETCIEIGGMDEKCDCDVNIELINQSYNITMSGEIEIRLSVSVGLKAIKKKEINLITNAYTDENAIPAVRRGVVIYFVQPGDTLWKIAKRYRAPVELISNINQIEDPNTIYVGQRLLIPSYARSV